MKRASHPSYTAQIVELLIAEPLLSRAQIVERLNIKRTVVTATLIHLYRHKAVAFLADEYVTLWYATPDSDTRSKKVLESPDEITRNRAAGAGKGTKKPRWIKG